MSGKLCLLNERDGMKTTQKMDAKLQALVERLEMFDDTRELGDYLWDFTHDESNNLDLVEKESLLETRGNLFALYSISRNFAKIYRKAAKKEAKRLAEPKVVTHHVICLNQKIQYVATGGEKEALIKLEELRRAHYHKHKASFVDLAQYLEACQWFLVPADGDPVSV